MQISCCHQSIKKGEIVRAYFSLMVVGATDPRYVSQLCTGTRSRLEYQLKPEVKRPRDLKNQHVDQRGQDQAKEQYIGKRRASLAGKASLTRGQATTRSKQPRLPGSTCRGLRGLNHHTNHTEMTHVINQCGVKPQGD